MLKKLMLVAVLMAATGLFMLPTQAVEATNDLVVDKTCKDVDGFTTNLEEDTSGVWGDITFESDNGPLVLNVNTGYTVTLCIKKGSVQNGNGPIVLDPFTGPLQDVEVNYPGFDEEDGFNHYAFFYTFEEPGRGNGPTPPKEEDEEEEQVVAPAGGVKAGGGAGTSALLGVLASVGTIGAGIASRKWGSLISE